jgi:hypothetical protein
MKSFGQGHNDNLCIILVYVTNVEVIRKCILGRTFFINRM